MMRSIQGWVMKMLHSIMTNLHLVISKYSLNDSFRLDNIRAKMGYDDVVFRHDIQDLCHIVYAEDCEDNVWSQDRDPLSCRFLSVKAEDCVDC